jgi:hypothetical protein
LSETIGQNFGSWPSKDHSTKVWLQLAQWFLRRRFVCEFPIGSYVKLSSAVGAILIEGPNRRTHFWKRTIQAKLKIEKMGDEIIPLEMHFFVDSLLLVTQIIKGKELYYKM